jgi:SAM-dependent methyltransferase
LLSWRSNGGGRVQRHIDLSANKSSANIEFIQGDVLSAALDRQFSIVVSLATIEHIPNVRSFTRRLRSLAKPNGLAIVMTLNDDSLLYWTARRTIPQPHHARDHCALPRFEDTGGFGFRHQASDLFIGDPVLGLCPISEGS